MLTSTADAESLVKSPKSPRTPNRSPRTPPHVDRSAAPWIIKTLRSTALWLIPLAACFMLVGLLLLRGHQATPELGQGSLRTTIHLQIPGVNREHGEALLKVPVHEDKPVDAVRNREEEKAPRKEIHAEEALPKTSEPEVAKEEKHSEKARPGVALDKGASGAGSSGAVAAWDEDEVRGGQPSISRDASQKEKESKGSADTKSKGKVDEAFREENPVPHDCDLFHGEWVYDESYPLYTNGTCKIISEHQNCRSNGRPDSKYESWRWQPHGCTLPRFDPHEFLTAMKGKRILFVGDSLSRNQLESLVCLLDQAEEHDFRGSRHRLNYIFRKADVVVSRVWSSWLVDEEVGSIPSVDKQNVTLLHLDRIGQAWLGDATGADVVVLSTGHWFVKPTVYMMGGMPVGVQMLRNNDTSLTMSNVEAFQTAIKTVFTQLRDNPKFKGLMIFRTYTPDHYEGGKWDTGGSCAGTTEPKPNDYMWRNAFGEQIYNHQVEEFAHAFATMKDAKKARRFALMDIMPMAATRADGHPGPFRGKQSLQTIEKFKGSKYPPPQDCLHWCLPGPVDNWNELLLPLIRRVPSVN